MSTDATMLLRVFIKESDHYQGDPLYLALLQLFRAEGLMGATALRGIAGYGTDSELHTDRILRLTQDLPVVVEVVDREDRLRAVASKVDAMLESGMVTLEPLEVIRRTPKK